MKKLFNTTGRSLKKEGSVVFTSDPPDSYDGVIFQTAAEAAVWKGKGEVYITLPPVEGYSTYRWSKNPFAGIFFPLQKKVRASVSAGRVVPYDPIKHGRGSWVDRLFARAPDWALGDKAVYAAFAAFFVFAVAMIYFG